MFGKVIRNFPRPFRYSNVKIAEVIVSDLENVN